MFLPALDTVTGCLLIATWASSFLYMFEIMESLYYFRHFEQDDWKFKTLVTVAVFVDTLSLVGDCICVYLYTITHAGMSQNHLSPLMAYWVLAGDAEYLENIHWPLPLYGFTTGVLAVLCQAFLVVRYWRFTKRTLIALSLSFAIIISFGSVFACSLLTTLYPSFGDRSKFKIPAALWLASEVIVDAGITSALLWEFRKARAILTETRSVLDRLTAVTIRSGAAAATLAGSALISQVARASLSRQSNLRDSEPRYYTKPESNVYVAFLYPLGRVYVITLLSNLNIRKSGKSFSTTDTSSGPGSTGGERGPLTFTHWATDDSCGIDLHRTVRTSVQVISVKSPQDRPP
ncbi:hypothetical protein K438DRAFT_1968572 [Mycena galopus ATCC 62051]|nr:hypothetical protein K438DRAFT_1968572 [Mycena galopus ATCC 62051]